jgi:hypothetical protein
MDIGMEDRNTLRALEESLWLAKTRFDPELMDKTFAESFVEFGRSGRRYERADMIFDSDPNAVIDAQLPLPDYALELIAPDVALATYTSIVTYGERVERDRRSSIWVKVEDRWKLRFHQGTPY